MGGDDAHAHDDVLRDVRDDGCAPHDDCALFHGGDVHGCVRHDHPFPPKR